MQKIYSLGCWIDIRIQNEPSLKICQSSSPSSPPPQTHTHNPKCCEPPCPAFMQATGTNQPRFWWNTQGRSSQHEVTGDQEAQAAGGEMFSLQFHMAIATKAVLISPEFPPGYFAQTKKTGDRLVAFLSLRWQNLGAMRHFCLSFYARNLMRFCSFSCISKEQAAKVPKNL